MMRSAHTLKFVWDAAQFDRVIQKLCERTLSHNHEPYLRLRLSLNPSGQFTTQLSALESPSSPVYVKVFPEPTHSKNPMLQHKTSLRAQYNRALLQAHEQGLFDFIFLNEKAQLTEGSRSFIALNIDGSWYTPPLDCGVLPSVMRTLCMQDPQYNIQERILYAEDLFKAQEICLGNALYGLLPARLI
jgi:para-aminobenzoate synthetase/4-amino-4-deoxychorismate lyase